MDCRFCPANGGTRLGEGKTVAIDYRWAEGSASRYEEIATEFARLKVSGIVTVGVKQPNKPRRPSQS